MVAGLLFSENTIKELIFVARLLKSNFTIEGGVGILYRKSTLVYIHVRKLCESVKICLTTNIRGFYLCVLAFQALHCI